MRALLMVGVFVVGGVGGYAIGRGDRAGGSSASSFGSSREVECPDYSRRLYEIETKLSYMGSTLDSVKSSVSYCD